MLMILVFTSMICTTLAQLNETSNKYLKSYDCGAHSHILNDPMMIDDLFPHHHLGPEIAL